MATRKGLPPEWRDLPPEFKHPSEFKLPLKVKLQVAGRFLVVLLGACAVIGAVVVAAVLFFHGGDEVDRPPAPARESAGAPKSPSPSFRAGSWCAHHPTSQWCQSPLPARITEPIPSGPEISAAESDLFNQLGSKAP